MTLSPAAGKLRQRYQCQLQSETEVHALEARCGRLSINMKASGYKMSAALLAAILLSCLLQEISGAAFASLEPCPDGVAQGESWHPPGHGCMRCDCNQNQPGYSCYSCGVMVVQPQHPHCYVDHDTPDALYPDCCNIKEFCPGDPGYDATKLTPGAIG